MCESTGFSCHHDLLRLHRFCAAVAVGAGEQPRSMAGAERAGVASEDGAVAGGGVGRRRRGGRMERHAAGGGAGA